MSATAISVRAPWWWFVLHGGKDIENRDWATKYRGLVYLHASKWWQPGEVAEDVRQAQLCRDKAMGTGLPVTDEDLRRMREAGGCLVGTVEIVDCVRQSSSPWFFGDYGFVLRNPVAFRDPVPMRGERGLFAVPDDVLARMPKPKPVGAMSLFEEQG